MASFADFLTDYLRKQGSPPNTEVRKHTGSEATAYAAGLQSMFEANPANEDYSDLQQQLRYMVPYSGAIPGSGSFPDYSIPMQFGAAGSAPSKMIQFSPETNPLHAQLAKHVADMLSGKAAPEPFDFLEGK